MALFKRKIQKESREVLINSKSYKVSITTEYRRNSRVSITKTGINIRLTKFLTKVQREEQIKSFLTWVEKTILNKKISFPEKYRKFKNGDILTLYDKDVVLEIVEQKIKNVSGQINKEKITVNIPIGLPEEDRNKYLSKIISRLLVKNYKAKIEKKILSFNELFNFGEINSVRLKNNSTNWGSCSSKNNINISIRLLLAPEDVLNYVLIHELSHLKHRNHSQSFWALVKECFPEYKKAELWLKKNSSKCII